MISICFNNNILFLKKSLTLDTQKTFHGWCCFHIRCKTSLIHLYLYICIYSSFKVLLLLLLHDVKVKNMKNSKKTGVRKYQKSENPRLRWTPELHEYFVEVVEGLGGKNSEFFLLQLDLGLPFSSLFVHHVHSQNFILFFLFIFCLILCLIELIYTISS